MSLDAQLQALTLPEGTEFPGTFQELLDEITQYMEITGLNPFNGINFGPTTPDASNRDRPWFQTTSGGVPIGWFSWNGSSWQKIPLVIPSGTTAQRPASPAVGTQYLDTTINVSLIFERSQWRTLAGSPGDVKFVKAATVEAAIAQNPGWVQDPDSPGRVIGAAGAGAGLTDRAYGATAGTEEVTLNEGQMPAHSHGYSKLPQPVAWAADGNVSNPAGNLASMGSFSSELTDQTGGNEAFPITQPTIFYWALVKS